MCCWIGVGPACPTRPPHQQGTELVDELEDLRLCFFEDIQPIGDQRYNGTWLPWYNQTAANPRKSTPPQFIRRMDWKFANAAAPVTVLSPVSRWRCAGDVLAAVAITVLSPGVAMCW